MKRTVTGRTRRPGVMLLGATIVVGALSGCSFMSPDTTNKPYAPAEGTAATIADSATGEQLLLRNILVVVPKGDPGDAANLVGSVVNSTERDMTLTFNLLDAAGQPLATGELKAPADSVVAVGKDEETVIFAPVEVEAGQVLTLNVQSELGGTTMSLPVLPADGDLADYGPSQG